MSNPVMMKCGCVASGVCTRKDGIEYNPGIPSCVVHGCLEVAESLPNLAGRVARCDYGDKEVPSSMDLPMFRHNADKPKDSYYCGCYGWD